MATSNGHRVGAFLLASVFLLTTIGTAIYVVYEINNEPAAPVLETQLNDQQQQALQDAAENAQQEQNTEEQTNEEQQVDTIANFTGPVEVSELRFEDEVVGDGDEVVEGATVTIHYTGGLATDGSIFDSSVARGEPAEFPLTSLIQGWQEGIPGMKVGGKRRLFIPAAQAYGASERPGIPANSDLIFDIELFATE